MLRFDDNTKLKEKETFGFDGSLVDITLVKSRTNKAGQFATLVFNQNIELNVYCFNSYIR